MLFPRRKREAILAAGFKLFAERGFENTSVPEIVRKAGVALATFYKYFPSKEALVNEIYRDLRRELDAALAILPSNGKSQRSEMRECWSRMAAFDKKHPAVVPFLEVRHHGAYLDRRSQGLENVPSSIVELMDRFRSDKVAKETPALVLAAIVWGTFVELVKLQYHGLLPLSKEVLEAAEECTWDAIRAGKR